MNNNSLVFFHGTSTIQRKGLVSDSNETVVFHYKGQKQGGGGEFKFEGRLLALEVTNIRIIALSCFSLVKSYLCLSIVGKQHLKYHVYDFQAFLIFLARYLIPLTAPTASRPETACLALETITFRFRIFCMHFAASSLELIASSCTFPPNIICDRKKPFHEIVDSNCNSIQGKLAHKERERANQYKNCHF